MGRSGSFCDFSKSLSENSMRIRMKETVRGWITLTWMIWLLKSMIIASLVWYHEIKCGDFAGIYRVSASKRPFSFSFCSEVKNVSMSSFSPLSSDASDEISWNRSSPGSKTKQLGKIVFQKTEVHFSIRMVYLLSGVRIIFRPLWNSMPTDSSQIW